MIKQDESCQLGNSFILRLKFFFYTSAVQSLVNIPFIIGVSIFINKTFFRLPVIKFILPVIVELFRHLFSFDYSFNDES